jgi:hypothetical protein
MSFVSEKLEEWHAYLWRSTLWPRIEGDRVTFDPHDRYDHEPIAELRVRWNYQRHPDGNYTLPSAEFVRQVLVSDVFRDITCSFRGVDPQGTPQRDVDFSFTISLVGAEMTETDTATRTDTESGQLQTQISPMQGNGATSTTGVSRAQADATATQQSRLRTVSLARYYSVSRAGCIARPHLFINLPDGFTAVTARIHRFAVISDIYLGQERRDVISERWVDANGRISEMPNVVRTGGAPRGFMSRNRVPGAVR